MHCTRVIRLHETFIQNAMREIARTYVARPAIGRSYSVSSNATNLSRFSRKRAYRRAQFFLSVAGRLYDPIDRTENSARTDEQMPRIHFTRFLSRDSLVLPGMRKLTFPRIMCEMRPTQGHSLHTYAKSDPEILRRECNAYKRSVCHPTRSTTANSGARA